MTRPDDFTVAVLIVLVLTILILGGAFVAAVFTIQRDEREAKRQAQANVRAWWVAGGDFGLVDSRPNALMSDDDAGDGSDEGLVRVAPDALLRQTLAARKEA